METLVTYTIDFDEEELRARAVQAISTSEIPQTLGTQPTPNGVSSGISSIEEVDAANPVVPALRPVLEEPDVHYMYKVLHAQAQVEESTARSSQLFDAQMKRDLAEMDRLSLEKEEELKKQAEAAATRDTWETLSNIGQYIAGAGAIALGTALGGIPGFLLVAGGVAGVGSRVIKDTNLLQVAVNWYTKSEELQKTITQRIEMGLFFLQMGLGLAGGYSAWTTGAFAATNLSALDVSQKFSGAISGASSAMTISGKVGSNFYDKQVNDHRALATELNGELTAQGHQISQDTGRITQRLQEDEQIAEDVRKAVRNNRITLD